PDSASFDDRIGHGRAAGLADLNSISAITGDRESVDGHVVGLNGECPRNGGAICVALAWIHPGVRSEKRHRLSYGGPVVLTGTHRDQIAFVGHRDRVIDGGGRSL